MLRISATTYDRVSPKKLTLTKWRLHLLANPTIHCQSGNFFWVHPVSISTINFRIWRNQFMKCSTHVPSWPKQITYGLLRAQGVKTVMNWCEKQQIDQMSVKFCHTKVAIFSPKFMFHL